MNKGNRGEWSELLVFLKLLSEGKLYAADSKLNKLNNIYYDIIKILREDSCENKEYYYDSIIKIKSSNGELLEEIPVLEFKEKAEFLLEKIKESKGSFSIEGIEGFLKKIRISKIKSKSSKKRDISMIVHDPQAGYNPELGFSIKSRLGSPSTLLNAGKTTNFIYELEGVVLDDKEIEDINSFQFIKEKIEKIKSNGGILKYRKMREPNFELNLQVIDSQFPIIASELIRYFYEFGISKISDLILKITDNNPCEFNQNNSHKFYKIKIKNFLINVALGMTLSKVWDDQFDATGGYIIVKENGDVLCYHVYNRDQFGDYLLNNTKLDTASTSRHNFGNIYKENGKFFMNLNFQIRFIK
ncbi:HpaII family restriction endonuclease [Candidatus Pacearchaeota archaeon]|nr:HpaII family restriction endonuclease [Candidatus Pacearchaeota archaeon]